MGERAEQAIEVTSNLLELCGVPSAWTSAFGLAAKGAGLIPEKTPLERFAKRAVAKFDGVLWHESAGLSDDDRDAAPERLKVLLSGGDRSELLGAALLGPATFREVLVGDGAVAYDGFGPNAKGYIDRLTDIACGLIVEYACDPEVLSESLPAALREILTTIDDVGARSRAVLDQELERRVRAAVADAMLLRPTLFILGDRPRLSTNFIARNEITKLREIMSSDESTRLVSLRGMRGVGKSQIASQFAQDCENSGWKFVGWVAAGSREEMISELASMARITGLEKAHFSPEDSARALISWVNGVNDDCLLVFDNVEDVDDILDFIPRGPGVRVLITTTQWTEGLIPEIDIEVYSSEQAIRYLNTATGLVDLDGAAAVAADLGYLPVALTQASTTIRFREYSYAEYRSELSEETAQLDDVMRRASGESYPMAVGAALRLSRDALLGRLLARDLALATRVGFILISMSMLAESGVPKSWVFGHSDSEGGEALTREAVGELRSASIVNSSSDGTGLMLHGLIARVNREDAGEKFHPRAVAELALVMMEVAFRQTVTGGEAARREAVIRLGAHLSEVRRQPASEPLYNTPDWLSLVTRVMLQANEHREPHVVIGLGGYVENLIAINGSDGVLTIAGQRELVAAYRAIGQPEHAIRYGERIWESRVRVLGEKNEQSLIERNNLGILYYEAKRFNDAIQLFEQNERDCEEVLGSSNPATVLTRNNLAVASEAGGRIHENHDFD